MVRIWDIYHDICGLQTSIPINNWSNHSSGTSMDWFCPWANLHRKPLLIVHWISMGLKYRFNNFRWKHQIRWQHGISFWHQLRNSEDGLSSGNTKRTLWQKSPDFFNGLLQVLRFRQATPREQRTVGIYSFGSLKTSGEAMIGTSIMESCFPERGVQAPKIFVGWDSSHEVFTMKETPPKIFVDGIAPMKYIYEVNHPFFFHEVNYAK